MNQTPPRVAIVGAGRMGRGIAIAFAYGGYEVDLIDFKPRPVADFDRVRAEIEAEFETSLGALVTLGAMSQEDHVRIRSRIAVVPESASADSIRRAELIFEAVPETLEAKRDGLTRICASAPSGAIIASTTSTILASELAEFVAKPERFLNAHWLNPAHIVPLVELSAHPSTSAHVVSWLKAILEDIGKVPVVCATAPGYIVPRLQALFMNEAARMVEEGVASADEIDKATRYGLGLRFASIGVLEFIDFGGNDILYHASRYLSGRLSPERYAAPDIVNRLMAEGRNGLKDGQGFFDYRSRDTAEYRRDVLTRTLGMLRHFGLQQPPR